MGICQRCERKEAAARGYCKSCHGTLRRQGKLALKYPPMPDSLTARQAEVMTGHMLGDGCLNKPSASDLSNTCLVIARQRRDSGFQEYTYETLRPFCWKPPVPFDNYDARTKKTYEMCRLTTRYAPVFTKLRREWYGPDRKKRLPKSLKLTPLTCAIWFCDDGCVSVVNKTTGAIRLKLSSHGFTREENERLRRLLQKAVGGKFYINTDGRHCFVEGCTDATRRFMVYVKDHVPSCMQRKLYFLDLPAVAKGLGRAA